MLLPAAKRAKFSSIPTALMMLSSSLTQHQLPVLRSIRETQVLSAMPAAPIDKTLTKVIGTHDGSFHCDEALAISMLKCLPEYESALVIRTRDPALLAQCSIVVDVGAVYNEAENRFDHHQREFQGTLDNYKTRLSSAGLVYKHFGKRILRSVLEWDAPASSVPEAFVDICYDKVYRNFIEHIDAIDNGISVADGELRYRISSTLSNRVGTLNPAWNEPQGAEVFNARFMDAMQLTVSEFCESAIGLWKYWWPARSIVQAAVDKRFEAHPSGKIIVLDQFCPWKDHLFEIEETIGDKIIYALYEDSGGSWRIQAVPEDPTSFHSRKKLPEPWCGLRDDVLAEKVGAPGAIFIHASGFIGGHKTFEGALKMASLALQF